MTDAKKINELEEKARLVRIAIIKMLGEAGSGHPGGSLSATDICTALFFNEMKHDPREPTWEKRDRFILSKGHAAPLLYVLLAKSGYFDESHLATLRKYKSILQGHPASYLTPGVEISTGSLGQGLSIAAGNALAGKMDQKDYRVFTLLGDGELDEGQIWEAAMFASHKKLDNLCAIVDRNYLQIDGNTENVMSLEPLHKKWKSFGWKVVEINGHDFSEILEAFENFNRTLKQPLMIIAKTVKGKGVSFMEDKAEWHGKPIKGKWLRKALSELRRKGEK